MDAEIAVVGAGVMGLATARSLAAAGHDVVRLVRHVIATCLTPDEWAAVLADNDEEALELIRRVDHPRQHPHIILH